jgi:hypothetical protein
MKDETAFSIVTLQDYIAERGGELLKRFLIEDFTELVIDPGVVFGFDRTCRDLKTAFVVLPGLNKAEPHFFASKKYFSFCHRPIVPSIRRRLQRAKGNIEIEVGPELLKSEILQRELIVIQKTGAVTNAAPLIRQ